MRSFKEIVGRVASALILAGASLGCGDGKTSSDDDAAQAGGKVVVGVLVGNLDDSRSIYVKAFDELPDGRLDLGAFQELGDGALYVYDDMVLHADWEAQSIVRLELDGEGLLVERGRISLANYGIPYLNTKPMIFSETRGYHVDNYNGQIIVFNPTTMEIDDTLAAPELVRDGRRTYLGYPRKMGERYLAPFSLYASDYMSIEPSVAIAVFEDDPERPLRVIRDERCAGGLISFVDGQGDLHVLGDNGGGYFDFIVGQSLPPACMLRVQANQTDFDESYYVDVYELTGARAVQGLWHVNDREFVLQAWADEVRREDLDSEDDFWLGENFDWMTIDLSGDEAAPLAGLPRSAPYSLVEFRVGDQAYLQRFISADTGGTAELYALRDGRAEKVLETAGEFWALGRLRAASPER